MNAMWLTKVWSGGRPNHPQLAWAHFWADYTPSNGPRQRGGKGSMGVPGATGQADGKLAHLSEPGCSFHLDKPLLPPAQRPPSPETPGWVVMVLHVQMKYRCGIYAHSCIPCATCNPLDATSGRRSLPALGCLRRLSRPRLTTKPPAPRQPCRLTRARSPDWPKRGWNEAT